MKAHEETKHFCGEGDLDLHTSIHDNVVGYPEHVMQYASELPSVQASHSFSRASRLPQKHVKLSDKTFCLFFVDWGNVNSSFISCVTFWFFFIT